MEETWSSAGRLAGASQDCASPLWRLADSALAALGTAGRQALGLLAHRGSPLWSAVLKHHCGLVVLVWLSNMPTIILLSLYLFWVVIRARYFPNKKRLPKEARLAVFCDRCASQSSWVLLLLSLLPLTPIECQSRQASAAMAKSSLEQSSLHVHYQNF